MAENDRPGQPGSPYQQQPYSAPAPPPGGQQTYPGGPPYQQTPYQQTPYQQAPYQQAPHPQAPHQQTSYQQAPYQQQSPYVSPQQPYQGQPYADQQPYPGDGQAAYATPQAQQPPPYAAGQQPPYGAAPYQTVSADQQEIWETQGKRAIGFGVAWLVGGLVITAVTYGAAAGGGVYVVAWGPALYGIYRIFSGLRLLSKARG